jgi:hypothetical protein
MKTLRIDASGWPLDFAGRLRLAGAVADSLLGEAMLLSWYDRDRDLESPRGVSECHEACAAQGAMDYARNRGAQLAVDFEAGRFVFCYLGSGSPDRS